MSNLPKSKEIEEKLRKLEHEAEERDAQRRAAALGLPYKNLITTSIEIDALGVIPEEEARKVKAAGLVLKGRRLAVAFYNPKSPEAEELLKRLKKEYIVTVFVVSLSSLEHAWSFYKYVSETMEEITGKVTIDDKRLTLLFEKLLNIGDVSSALGDELKKENGFSISSILEVILAGALALRASDIHLEAEEEKAKMRYRIDGLLHDIYSEIYPEQYRFLISRIKLLSDLKLNVRDEPQDGRFTINIGKEIEVRVSVIPAEFGETVVMRILDPDTIKLNLEDLGFRADDLKIVEAEIKRPNGLILNTGPTGSGKTTTLYAFLERVNDPETKIITIEDPIEYHLEGIEQTQVDPDAGYTFASGLRAILRQDPDVILVGEIRDQETAEIAMHAALTGHIVFSTLHTNDAVGAIPRLIDIGIKPTIVGPAVTLIIAQRLVRRLCPECKTAVQLSDELKVKIKKFLEDLPERVDRAPYNNVLQIYQAKGCSKCNGFGYRGRIGIFELLIVTQELQELIIQEASEIAIEKLARKQGMVKMQEDGILKVLMGITTFEEVEEATGPLFLNAEL
jgi:type IV pilus assembly protein PilB